MYILLIEDDNFFRSFYAQKLREKGFEVGEAPDGEAGLNSIMQRKPDFVLLDLIMPKKDGFEVLSTLQSQGLTNQIPVLVFSTLGQQKDIDKAAQLGAKGYVNKSFFDFENLYQRIVQLTQPQQPPAA